MKKSDDIDPPIFPAAAPFSQEQREWLNKLFSGLLSGFSQASPNAWAQETRPVEDEPEPWHDPTLPLDERLRLAEGKPIERRLMAAMAQLDCGTCGYLCKTYAGAIATGEEKDLGRCTPGGRETARKLKELLAGRVTQPAIQVIVDKPPDRAVDGGFSEARPFPAPLVGTERLNGPGSEKDTRLVVLDLTGSGLKYQAGDSLGVFPRNCYEHVDAILRLAYPASSGVEPVILHDGRASTLRDAMIDDCDLGPPTDELLDTMAACADDKGVVRELIALKEGKPTEGLPGEPDVIDVLARFPNARPEPRDFIRSLGPLRPRLYSISSSPKLHPNEVHLTVGVMRRQHDRRIRKGVASTYLAERVLPRQPVRIFIRPSHGFRPPDDPNQPMIMIGPGTGIAPFRAFLQDREASGARGRNWLFFGDQHESTDFLYRTEIERYLQTGLLTRVTTAFSRDQAQRIHVPRRMSEHSVELWSWLQAGAAIYVCGNASRMAVDVDKALHEVIAGHSTEGSVDAQAYVANLRSQRRYQRDVY